MIGYLLQNATSTKTQHNTHVRKVLPMHRAQKYESLL